MQSSEWTHPAHPCLLSVCSTHLHSKIRGHAVCFNVLILEYHRFALLSVLSSHTSQAWQSLLDAVSPENPNFSCLLADMRSQALLCPPMLAGTSCQASPCYAAWMQEAFSRTQTDAASLSKGCESNFTQHYFEVLL